MNRFIRVLLLFSICFGNGPQETEPAKNPCADPVIAYARKHGVKAVPLKDLMHYYRTAKNCSKAGGEEVIQQIRLNEYTRDYRESGTMSGWTSTHAVCVGIVIFYYFLGLLISSKPKSD